jgi:hypothetical protein
MSGTESRGGPNIHGRNIAPAAIAASHLQSSIISSSELAETVLRYSEISLTAAQVIALTTTPAVLVAAPGAGKVIEFISAVLFLDYGTVQFAEVDDNLAILLDAATDVQVSETIEMTGFINIAGDVMTTARRKLDNIAVKADCENQQLILKNINDAFTGGTGSVLRVKTTYRVHATGW